MKQRLLPRRFKLVGILVIVAPIIVLVILKLLKVRMVFAEARAQQIGTSAILAGILLIILSREKTEDEFVDSCRLTAFRMSFICGIVQVIMSPIFNFKDTNSQSFLLLAEMFFYLIIFHALRKGIIRYGK